MNPTTTATSAVWTNWIWPEDVLAFAAEHEAEQYLEPLREALARIYPTALRATAALEQDPELRDVRNVTFLIDVPDDDFPELFPAHRAWTTEYVRLVPPVKLWVFRVFVYPVD